MSLKCPICDANFANPADLGLHMSTHSEQPPQRSDARVPQYAPKRESAYVKGKSKTIVVKSLPFMITCNKWQDVYLFSLKRMTGRDPDDPAKGVWDQLTMRLLPATVKKLGELLVEAVK